MSHAGVEEGTPLPLSAAGVTGPDSLHSDSSLPAEGPRRCSQHNGGRSALSRVLIKTLVFESFPGTDMYTTE